MHATYQGPMGLELNIEQTVGGIIGFAGYDNFFQLTGTASHAGGNSLGIGYVEQGNYLRGRVYYDKVHIHDNVFDGFYIGMYVPNPHFSEGALSATKTVRTLTDNTVINCGLTPYYIWPNSGELEPAKIVSNRCVTGATDAAETWRTLYDADQDVFAKLTNITGVRLVLGQQEQGNYNSPHYELFFSSTTVAQVWRGYDPGYGMEYEQLGADIAITHSADDQWKLSRVGTTLTVYKNGVSVTTRTATETDPGMWVFILVKPITA